MKNVIYPENCKAVINVTKPPYNVDNTGKTDCTAQLVSIIDSLAAAQVEALERTKKKLEEMDDPNAMIGFEIRKYDGRLFVVFPEVLPESKIIYFPNGVYLVSDTISYSLENLRNLLFNLPGWEMNRQFHFMGQSREGTVIRLKDNCPGFGFGADRPVVSFMRGERANTAFCNSFENITIDIGKGNAGATGLVFYGNNAGAVRNVTIRSGDENFRGSTGLKVEHEIVSGCFVKDVEIVGFDYGIKVTPFRNFTVFDNIRISHQRRAGFFVGNTITSIRGLISDNTVPALRITGPDAHVILTDGDFTGRHGDEIAVRHEMGVCYLRNVTSKGYMKVLLSYLGGEHNEISHYISEFSSHGINTLFGGSYQGSLSLEVEDTPELPWEEPNQWCCVNDYGAKGDGVTDNTRAIQAALNAGYPAVYFQPGRYLIDGVIDIPAEVNRINFMYCDLIAGDKLKQMENEGTFKVSGESQTPLIIEDLFAFEKYCGYMRLVNHASKRTLVMSDIHSQCAAVYFNTAEGGRVYIENCACTVGGEPYRQIPGFSFKGQKVWARQINPERAMPEIKNEGSDLWVMGFKSEAEGTVFHTSGGGRTEVLGGIISLGLNKEYPAVLNDNSQVSVVASTNGLADVHGFPIAVKEIQNGVEKELLGAELPQRAKLFYHIPLYVGK